jgi:hypothetical protein
MLKDVNRQKLQEAKKHAQELLQDIEQMEEMLKEGHEDNLAQVIIFNQNLLHSATMNGYACTGIFQDIDKQAYIGTHLESKWTPEQKAERLKNYQIEEARQTLIKYALLPESMTLK